MNIRKLFLKLNGYFRKIHIVKTDVGLSDEELIDFANNSPFEADVIWRSRNVIWLASRDDHSFVVKTFYGSFKNSIIYAFRRSKARRSYEHAVELLKRGFATPRPLGFVEIRGIFHILTHSCYASSYTEGISLAESIEKHGKTCLDAFAFFVARLHSEGIRHDDLNETNVRVIVGPKGEFDFTLIDLNRMKILPPGQGLTLQDSLVNICRFCKSGELFDYFAKQYVEVRGLSGVDWHDLVKVKMKFDHNFWRKKRLLHVIRDFFRLK